MRDSAPFVSDGGLGWQKESVANLTATYNRGSEAIIDLPRSGPFVVVVG